MDPNEATGALGTFEDSVKNGRRVLRVFHRALLHHSGITIIYPQDDGPAELRFRVGETLRLVNAQKFCDTQRKVWADLVGKVISRKVDGLCAHCSQPV